MPILNLFSKRQKELRGEKPDVYVFDDLPTPLRVQIVHIVRDAVGTDEYNQSAAEETYEFVHQALCREYGLFTLKEHASSYSEAVFDFFLKTDDFERAIDIVELCFAVINSVMLRRR